MKKIITLILVLVLGLATEVVNADFSFGVRTIVANVNSLCDDNQLSISTDNSLPYFGTTRNDDNGEYFGDGTAVPEEFTQCIDVSGEWTVVDTTTTQTFGDQPKQNSYTITITQFECQLTVTFPGGTLTGSIDENIITLSGSMSDEGGTSTVEMSVTVTADGNSFQGSYSFTWTDGAETNTGTSQLIGSRTGGSTQCVDVRGEWIITEIVGPNNCGDQTGSQPPYIITMEQRGCMANVRTPQGEFIATISGNNIIWAALFSEGDGTTTSDFSLTIEGNSLSGTASWTWSDGSATCSGTSTLSGTRQNGGWAGENSASQFINGLDGGTISVRNSRGDIISLEIPLGALPNSMIISLTAPNDLLSNPIASNIFPGVIIEPNELILNQPARLKVSLANALPDPELSRLFWLRTADFVLFIANQSSKVTQIEGEIHHFSPYIGGLPSKDEIIQQAKLLAQAQDLGLTSDPYGWIEVYDTVNGLLQAWEIFEVLGNYKLADSYFNGALGALEQGAYKFLNMSIPSEPCGQYHAILYKFARLAEVLLDDPVLLQEFQDRQREIDNQCIGDMIGTYNGPWLERYSSCRDPKDNGRRGGLGSITIDSQSESTFSGYSSAGSSLAAFSGTMKPIGFVYGISTYSLRGNATYSQQEYYEDEYGNVGVRTVSGTASFSGIWAGDTISVRWSFRDTKGDTCSGAGSGKFTKL